MSAKGFDIKQMTKGGQPPPPPAHNTHNTQHITHRNTKTQQTTDTRAHSRTHARRHTHGHAHISHMQARSTSITHIARAHTLDFIRLFIRSNLSFVLTIVLGSAALSPTCSPEGQPGPHQAGRTPSPGPLGWLQGRAKATERQASPPPPGHQWRSSSTLTVCI